jgi:hypothetical protein
VKAIEIESQRKGALTLDDEGSHADQALSQQQGGGALRPKPFAKRKPTGLVCTLVHRSTTSFTFADTVLPNLHLSKPDSEQ